MTKVIGILIAIVVVYCAWHFYLYWVDVKNDDGKQAQVQEINPNYLPGMPSELLESYLKAKQESPKAVGNWLAAYGSQVSDPRKAWIQLDYVVSITRENPQEAKRVFAEVKSRLSENSPVMPRVKQLAPTYE
jgi:hypothetical protein